MPIQAVFGLSVLLSLVAWGIVATFYVVPKLRVKSQEDALLPMWPPLSPVHAWAAEYAAPGACRGQVDAQLRQEFGTGRRYFAGLRAENNQLAFREPIGEPHAEQTRDVIVTSPRRAHGVVGL